MANKLFEGIINQMKEIIDRTIGIIDTDFTIITSSDPNKINEVNYVASDLGEVGNVFAKDGYTYKAFGSGMKTEYAVFVEGIDEQAKIYVSMLTIMLTNIKEHYDKKYDRTNFIKNVVLENILPGDIYAKARELQFTNNVYRVVFLIRISAPNDIAVYEVIQNLFPDKSKDFIFNINEEDVILVKEVKEDTNLEDLYKLGNSIVDTLSSEFYIPATVGVGTAVQNVKDLSNSFKESQVALEVGKVFDSEKSVISYENLGIARLIYQLPTTLCEMFLKEVFKKGSIDDLDQETLFTIQKFFENNLNVSETSRKLFVHRNTLVYRLEKIKKITGLDLREFEHAIIFKVALMVKKYLDTNPIKY